MEIRLYKEIMGENKALADQNRAWFETRGVTAVNVMASPGAGKTTLIERFVRDAGAEVPVGVIEGDIASAIDAEKFDAMGLPVVQINTGGGCHLDAVMIRDVVPGMDLKRGSVLFIENVGNLVCPSAFDLGEALKLVIASVPEGHDKPFKYTDMFASADAVVLSKMDLLPYIRFDMEVFQRGVRAVNPSAPLFCLSCENGDGVDEFVKWVKNMRKNL